ncbi:MAG: GUN4 domain-containing protein, partial [Microcystis panniformis]
EERWAEIFRLAFAEKENPERFREQFDKMISVQYNREADKAYEKELIKQREHLIENQEQIYQKLEEYLEQQDWKKADYETAFIMYQWMVIENYDDFYDLFRGVSLKVINEIDRLWMQYSNQQFGIKGQARIYRDRGGTEDYNREVWERFGDCVGWRRGGIWLELENIEYPATADLSDFTFPILIYHHFYQGGGGGIVYGAKRISTLASRLESQDI